MRLCREALAEGFTHFKVKVGGAPEDDERACGWSGRRSGRPDLMIDANQQWDVEEAIRACRRSRLQPVVDRGADSPDDVLGHAAIGRPSRPDRGRDRRARANRVMFKQLLQADAIDFCQIDSCRLGGVNENLAVMLLAAKFGVPVCPHAGGVGLCELVQHLSMFDYLRVSGRMDDRVTEFVDHLHEHFVHPTVIRRARYVAPEAPATAARLSGSRGRSIGSRTARPGV